MVTLKLTCGGCFAEVESGQVRRTFTSFSGQSYGFGRWHLEKPLEDYAPDGWVMFDPWTQCTYCSSCWASILYPNYDDDGWQARFETHARIKEVC